jgi:hypothetical protein
MQMSRQSPVGETRVDRALTAYRRALATCGFFAVVPEHNRSRLVRHPLGVALRGSRCFSPHDLSSAPFLTLLQRLDELCYGPRGMQMPRWVFYDCAEMVGGLFGFGRRSADLPPWVRATLAVPEGYDGFVPLSLLVLVPMLEPGALLCHALCSLNQVAPGAAPAGLRTLTQVVGLSALPARAVYATTQWRSPNLALHTALCPLDLVTAYTPAHSIPATLTFRADLTTARLRRALRGAPRAPRTERWLDVDDERALAALQAEIEAGERWCIAGAPVLRGSEVRVPLSRRPA